MCLIGIRESDLKIKRAYKILDKGQKTQFTHQKLKKGVFNWPKYKSIDDGVNLNRENWVTYSRKHLNKISVYLEKPTDFSVDSELLNEVWEVEVKYKKLMVGYSSLVEGGYGKINAALVDAVKLIKKVRPRKGGYYD